MGLVNLVLVQLSKFIDSYVQNVSEDEIAIQVRVKSHETSLNSLLNSIKKDDEQKKDLTFERREIAELIKSTKRNKTNAPCVIVAWEHRKEECAAKYKYILFQIAETQKTVTKVQSELKKSKKISERMRKVRVKYAVGFEVKLEKSWEKNPKSIRKLTIVTR